MKKIVFIVFVVCLVVGLSCQDKGTEPQPSYPTGYQRDIPWPSLADSPWPMHHGNPQSTGRSKYLGPSIGQITYDGNVNWIFKNAGYFFASPLVDSKGNIYLHPGIPKDTTLSGFISLYPNGQVRWIYRIYNYEYVIDEPTIDKSGNLYFKYKHYILSVDYNGNFRWIFDVTNEPSTSLICDDEETIYLCAGGIMAISSSGTLK